MPQLSPTERDLMALLQQERERNRSIQAAADPLPELDMSLFLSPAAQREIEAVRGIPKITLPLMSETFQVSKQELTIRPVADAIDLNLGSNWEIQESDLEPRSRYASTEVAPDLANLFMDRALQETGADQRRAERLGTEVEFSFTQIDGDIDIASPRMYQAPRSSTGVEVARRGPAGFTQISRQEAIARSQATRAVQPAASTAPPQALAKSRHERLLGPSIID